MLLLESSSSHQPWPDRYSHVRASAEATRRWSQVVETFPASKAEQRALIAILSSGVDGFKSRAAMLDIIPPLVAQHDPRRRAEAQTYREQFTQGSLFGLAPVEEITLMYCFGARMVYPSLSIGDGCVRFIQDGFEQLTALPLFNPVFAACENNPQVFIDLVTTTGEAIFFNKGDASHTRLGERTSRVRYEGYPVAIMEPLFLGFYKGLLTSLTGGYVNVDFDVINAHTGELHLVW